MDTLRPRRGTDDPLKVNALRALDDRDEQRKREAYERLGAQPEFREFVMHLVYDLCKVDSIPKRPDHDDTLVEIGKREAGLAVKRLMMRFCPDAWIALEVEKTKRQIAREVATRSPEAS